MCGRFAFYSPREAVVALFRVDFPFDFEPRYNIAPTQPVAAIRTDSNSSPEAVMLRWGLVPSWARDMSIGHRLINARAETLGMKPAFRDAWRRRRCVILASGFYEWRRDGRNKIPYYVSPLEGQPIAMAGLWEYWKKGGETLETCTIITTEANREVSVLHERMPAIIPAAALRLWLDPRQSPEVLQRLLQPSPAGLFSCYEVSKAVNAPANEGPALVERVTSPQASFSDGRPGRE